MTAVDIPAFTGEVHPVADLFPMLADDELRDLAASISERGLDHPIVLDGNGRLLDGRNRLAACKLAGLEPRFEAYDGDDADDYALRSGITRRHLNTGARAIIAEQARRLNGVHKSVHSQETGIHRNRYEDAAAVLDWEPALAPAVIAGLTPLSKAVEQARGRKKASDSDEAKLTKLRADTPDLADLVVEERMTLTEAVAAAERRAEEQKARVRTALDGTTDAVVRLTSILGPAGGLDRVADNWAPETTKAWLVEANRSLLEPDGLRDTALLLEHLAALLEKNR